MSALSVCKGKGRGSEHDPGRWALWENAARCRALLVQVTPMQCEPGSDLLALTASCLLPNTSHVAAVSGRAGRVAAWTLHSSPEKKWSGRHPCGHGRQLAYYWSSTICTPPLSTNPYYFPIVGLPSTTPQNNREALAKKKTKTAVWKLPYGITLDAIMEVLK